MTTRPRCGNDPRAQLTDQDRAVVDEVLQYLRDRQADPDPGGRWIPDRPVTTVPTGGLL